MNDYPESRCPHCKARGVRQMDAIERDGYVMRFDYCGICGKNYPIEKPKPEVKAQR